MSHENMEYVHPLPVRIWHWVNAAGFVLLVLTGFQIRFAESLGYMSFDSAVTLHNWVGITVIFDYFLWFLYYFGSGKIRIYYPDLATFIPRMIRQARYYGYGIFIGDENPHHMTAENKFNAMQQKAYIMLMFVMVPLQLITGLCLWDMTQYGDLIAKMGGLKVVDTIHVFLFYFFAIFMVVHAYLATLGHTVSAHFVAMFTGWEEHH